MTPSSGHWYAVLSSRELRRKPVAKLRFGERLVFWREASGRPACVADRCAHRGAALSLGRVRDGQLECPFHAFRYDASGRCVGAPTEGPDWPIPPALRVPSHAVTEADGYVWLWRGPVVAPTERPAPPALELVAGLPWGEVIYTWPTHYTRCIESVIDFSHLPFVHRTTMGLFIRNPHCTVEVEPAAGGFRAWRRQDTRQSQFIAFLYPNVWLNRVGRHHFVAATFAPMDESRTEAYVRWYYPRALRFFAPLVDVYGRWSQNLVFRDDQPIIGSQQPANVDDADSDRLVPSDAAHLAYRKLRRAHQQELREWRPRGAPPGQQPG